MAKSKLGREGLIGLTFPGSQSIIEGIQEETQARNEGETTGECCLLAHLQAHSQPAVLHSSGSPA